MINKVDFDKESSVFTLSSDGRNIPYYYVPNCRNLWDNLNDEDFTVVRLNNPFLFKEKDYFEVKFDGSEERGGYLFPIALLESEETNGRALLSYLFVAFRTLLKGIDSNMPLTGVLSDSYKDAYILIVHNQTIPNFDINNYITSLANWGFYEYRGEVKSKFPKLDFLNELPKTLQLNKSFVDNSDRKYVNDLLKNRLCGASDFITRFVLVYQVVELYISEIHSHCLDEAINKFTNKELTKNDFAEELKKISREAYQIEQLFKGYIDEDVCNKFKQESIGLFNDVRYKFKSEAIPSLFYALRNQVFHNYDIFIGHEDALSQVIFRFEQVVLMLLSKRKIKF